MLIPARPANEDARLDALRKYAILESGRETSYDDITRLASEICGTSISMVSMIDRDRLWVKAVHGLDVKEAPRDIGFCSHTILQEEMLVVPNMLEDERFADNPLVTGAPDIRFYAGTQLTTPENYNVGTLCVLDRKPMTLDEKKMEALRILARSVMTHMELRKNLTDLALATEKAVAMETIIRTYTSKSVWERADFSARSKQLQIADEMLPLTFLFLDTVGFTAFSRKSSPEYVVSTLNRYFGPIVGIIHERGGDVDKFIGDAIFATFAQPQAAVEAARAIQQEVRRLNESRLPDVPELLFTIGMNTGHVIRGNVGGESRRDNTLIGDAVNVAARVQSVCQPGKILVTDALLRQLPPGLARLESSSQFQPKGIPEMIGIHYIV